MSNFGIGLGSFLSGFTQGAGAAQSLKRGMQQEKLTDMQIKNLEDQQAATQGARDLSAQGVKDATANTDGQIDNVIGYYMQNVVPKLQQHWLANGDVEKANAFGEWTRNQNVQQGMKYAAGMIRAAHLGDAEGAMNYLVKAYNQPDYFDDGQSAVGAKIRRDDKGNAAGMDITLRNDRTGEETTHTFNSMNEVYQLAMQFGSPEQVFKSGMEQLQAGQKAAADAAKEKRDWDRKLTEKEIDQGYKLEGQTNESQLRSAEKAEEARNGTGNRKITDAKATIAFLKENGASDEYIKSNMAGILGIENRSRPISSRIDDYIKMRTDSDRKFSKMTLDAQIKEAQAYISAVDRQTSSEQGVGVPQEQQPQQQGGLPFLDTKTGQIIYR